MTTYPNRLELIIKNLVHKIIPYSVSKNQYVAYLRQKFWLHNNNRINGNEIALSLPVVARYFPLQLP